MAEPPTTDQTPSWAGTAGPAASADTAGPTGRPALLDDPTIDLSQRMLLASDGYVVRLLETCHGEPVRAAHRAQHTETGADRRDAGADPLTRDPDEPVLCRRVWLQGTASQRTFLVADSRLALDRLHPGVRDELLNNDTPLGYLLAAYRVETCRELDSAGRTRAGALAPAFAVDAGHPLVWRTYRILSGGRPIAVITEYLPPRQPPGSASPVEAASSAANEPGARQP